MYNNILSSGNDDDNGTKKQNKFEKFEKLLDKFRKESIINTRVTTEAENASESFKVCFCKEKEKTLKKMKKVVDKHQKM